MQTSGNPNYCLVARFLYAIEMALQFGINVLFAKHIDEPLRCSLCFLCPLCVSSVKCFCEGPIATACQTNQSFRMRGEFFRCNRALTRLGMLRHTQLHQRDQATEILIAGAIADEEWN